MNILMKLKMKQASKALFMFAAGILGVFIFSASCAYCADFADDSFELIVSNSPQFTAKDTFIPGKDSIFLRLIAGYENKDRNKPDSVRLRLRVTSNLDTEDVILIETDNDTGIFQNANGVSVAPGNTMIGNGTLEVSPVQDTIRIIHLDHKKQSEFAIVKTANAVGRFIIVAEPFQVAGKPFRAEVIAQDKQGNISVAYSGKLSLEAKPILPKKAASKLSPDKISSFANGKNSIFATYRGSGIIKIIVKDKDNNIVGESGRITFLPAKFRVKLSVNQTVGKSFDMEVVALDFNNEVSPNYTGNASIKLVNTDKVIKKDMRFIRGIAKANIIVNSCGEKKFMVCDKKYPEVCGISEGILFRPYSFKVKVDSPAGKRKKFYFDEVFKGKISVLDYRGREVLGYGGVVRLKPVKNIDIPINCSFNRDAEEGLEFSISGITDVPFRLEVYDPAFPQIKGESDLVTLMPAKLTTELIEKKDNKAVLRIKIVNNKGGVVKEDSSTVFTVYLAEGIPDRSAFLDGPKKIMMRNGMAEITIVDNQREIVSVTPNAGYDLGIEPFDVNFE